MSLEDFSPEIESSEWSWNSAEVSKEASEKQKEASKKAAKVQKDEKKAKKYDFLLAWFLVKIIVDKKYDFILDILFPTIHIWYPSNFVLWIISLINDDISNKIREISKKEKIVFNYLKTNEIIEFDDNHINVEIQKRINFWIEDIIDSLIIEYSEIQTQRLKELLIKDDNLLINYISKIFIFFLKWLNINISENKSENISLFIISEIKKQVNNLKLKEV